MKRENLLSTLLFRRATIEDLSAILKLLAEDELGKTRELLDQDSSVLYKATFQKIDADPSHQLMVIEFEGLIIGTCHLTLLPTLTFRGATRLQIESVRVAKEFRNSGIGTWMFEKIFEYAKERDVAIMQLTTNKKREAAKRFYEQLGFEATHEGMKKYV